MSRGNWRDLDEDDVRVRAGRRTRPRTKRRPAHTEAVAARVVRTDRGRYTCLLEVPDAGATGSGAASPAFSGRPVREDDAGRPSAAGRAADAPGGFARGAAAPDPRAATPVTAMRARELGRTSIVVGDLVALVGDTSGDEGTLARIVRVEPRRTVLRRSADDADPAERVIVANADQLVVVSALASPPPRPRLIDRCLAAAYDAGMDAVLCLTKADLASAAPLRALYEPLGLRVVATELPDDTAQALAPDAAAGPGLEEMRGLLAGRVSVLVGHSGVGKSTLINALIPGAGRRTGGVNAVTGRGRHTSTGAEALPLPAGGWAIDTPGIRSFGL
ncbi:MAG: ribosome small subunit-dependent GTPase A, partial [Bifidobacteriaceae bacterium]|nr:ribosome small subunit-dependent GTPase A [Bifidobacteriaceae bacterium]